nr:tellurite resistance TerB family protein [Desulfovibrio sp.]
RADGTVDAEEQAHITATMQQFFPGQDTGQLVQALLLEPLDVRAVVAGVGSMEQAEDVYAMSCMATGIDHPAERAYMNDLAAALSIPPERRDAIERGAAETRARLSAQTQAPAAAADPVAAPVADPATDPVAAPVADPATAPAADPVAAPVAAPEPVQAEASAPAESAQPVAPKQVPSGQTEGTGNGV